MDHKAQAGRIREYVFSGTPRQRGLAHGEELRGEIASHLELWKDDCRKSTGMEPAAYLDLLYAETNFMPAIEAHAPSLLDEVRGIADGAGQEFRVVLARQLSDEEPWFRRNLRYRQRPLPDKLRGKEQESGVHCSAFAAVREPGLPPVIAQNMDTPRYYRKYQILIRSSEPGNDLGQMIFTIAGKLSLCGMNSRGVAVCCNTVHQLDYDPAGLPEDFIVRKILECSDLNEARAFIQRVPHASGQNYVIGSPEGAVSMECSAHQTAAIEPDPATGRLAHTNHPLVNTDRGIYIKALELARGNLDPADEKRISLTTTYRRLETLERLMSGYPVLSINTMKSILGDGSAPLCVGEESHYTLGSLIMELDGSGPRMHIAQDPPAGGTFFTCSF